MNDSRRFGRVAAAAATITSLGYALPQVLQVIGVLADPWDRILIFAPSLLLAPSFVCAMAAAVDLAPAAASGQARAAFGVATWLLAGALPREPRNRWLRWMLIANDWLLFALIGQLVEPRLILVGAAWLVTFPAAMILLWRRFSALD